MSDYRGHKVRVNLNGEEFDALRAEAGRTGNGMATLLRERFLQSLAAPDVSALATYTFTRASLATALTRLEIKISLYSPETMKIDAESMADAIIKALGQSGGLGLPQGRRYRGQEMIMDSMGDSPHVRSFANGNGPGMPVWMCLSQEYAMLCEMQYSFWTVQA